MSEVAPIRITHYKNMRLYYYIDHLRYQQDKIGKLILTK
jgi:hypothetical protein